ncbi:MAG TPA: VanZ family protein [Chryseosolibacter sp.]
MKYLTLIASVLIIVAVLIPGSNIPDVEFTGVDKFVHISMFAAWAVALRFDFPLLKWWQIFMLGIIFSFLTEVLQLFAEGRSFDTYDMVSDAIGLALGLLVAKPVVRILSRVLGQRT